MNTESTTISEWIRNNCLKASPDTQLSGGTRLLEEVGLDSLEIVRLVNFVEDEFQISVDVEELVPENFETLDRVVAMVQRMRAQQTDMSTSTEDQSPQSTAALA
jgi:D-alanine--poly(phosphoribitol) ligase subunit 2